MTSGWDSEFQFFTTRGGPSVLPYPPPHPTPLQWHRQIHRQINTCVHALTYFLTVKNLQIATLLVLKFGWICQYHGCWYLDPCFASSSAVLVLTVYVDYVYTVFSRALWGYDSHGVRASGAGRRQKYTHSQQQWWENSSEKNNVNVDW